MAVHQWRADIPIYKLFLFIAFKAQSILLDTLTKSKIYLWLKLIVNILNYCHEQTDWYDLESKSDSAFFFLYSRHVVSLYPDFQPHKVVGCAIGAHNCGQFWFDNYASRYVAVRNCCNSLNDIKCDNVYVTYMTAGFL